MQRLYSAFPDSWPGVALVIMRVMQGVQVLAGNPMDTIDGATLTASMLYGLQLLTAGSLAIGLWTPVAGLLLALLECGAIYTQGYFDLNHFDAPLLCVCLAMLGPGAWSVDARLYGRRRIRID